MASAKMHAHATTFNKNFSNIILASWPASQSASKPASLPASQLVSQPVSQPTGLAASQPASQPEVSPSCARCRALKITLNNGLQQLINEKCYFEAHSTMMILFLLPSKVFISTH